MVSLSGAQWFPRNDLHSTPRIRLLVHTYTDDGKGAKTEGLAGHGIFFLQGLGRLRLAIGGELQGKKDA